MSHAFEVTRLIGGSHLIEGTDESGKTGSTVLYSPSWNAVVAARKTLESQEVFDLAVRDFFKPLTQAADAAKASPDQDWGTVVIMAQEPGTRGEAIELDPQGMVLRILDEERGDLLRWAGDSLVAIAG